MFDLEALSNVDDGALDVAFRREVHRAARDLLDRPKVAKDRTVTIKVHLKAVTDGEGEVRGAAVECELVPAKIPNYVTFPQPARFTTTGNGLALVEPGEVTKQQLDPDEA